VAFINYQCKIYNVQHTAVYLAANLNIEVNMHSNSVRMHQQHKYCTSNFALWWFVSASRFF